MTGTVDARQLLYRPAGPVLEAFIRATPRGPKGGAGIKICEGPVGSGKTRGMFAFGLAMIPLLRPDATGTRWLKICTTRQTYRDLWRSTIPSWWKQIPQEGDGIEWSGAKDGPAVHTIKFDLNDGTKAVLIKDFVAFGEDPESALRGYEPTMFEVDEIDLIPVDVIGDMAQRCGRFPDETQGGPPPWFGIVGVCNAIPMFHPLRKVKAGAHPGWAFFRQPGGFSPDAENLAHLPPGYYEGQVAIMQALGQRDRIKRMVHNEPSLPRGGKPVFDEEFSTDRHVSKSLLQPDPSRVVYVGGDAGRHPAAVFLQRTDRGQWRNIGELYCPGMSAERFGPALNRYIQETWPNTRLRFEGWGDPASDYGTETSEKSWLAIMSAETGFVWRPAPGGNDLETRISAVSAALTFDAGYGMAGMTIDPRCQWTIEGLGGAYIFREVKGQQTYHDDKPAKNEHSHIMDALQNGILGGGGYAETRYRKRERQANAGKQFNAATDFNVLG